MATKFVTGKVRFSFCFLNKSRTNDRGEEKFSTTILVPKNDPTFLKMFRAAEREAAVKKFPGKGEEFYKAIKSVLHDGDGLRPTGEAFGPECKGCWAVSYTHLEPTRPY